MAATKRKADDGTDNESSNVKRSRASTVRATAAMDRPRRSARNDSDTKAVASSTAKKVTTTKSGTRIEKDKTTKVTAKGDNKQKAEKGKQSVNDRVEGKKRPGKVREEPITTAKVAKLTDDSKTKKAQGTSKTPAATKGAKKSASTESEERATGETRYWLMKAEPESRFEKGVDVKFSIHDLELRTDPEPWDGVRNPMAQKNMRNMKKGDLAFFYHSNCKVPGIAGLIQIAREHSIDESAFDEKHPYFDPKSSRDKPRWHVVHVEHLRTLEALVPLKDLQKHAKDGGPLVDMQVLRMSRLSVSQVSAKEWEYILRELIGINPKDVKANETS